MKRIIVALTIVGLLAGCTSETEFGRCVGVQAEKDPALVYEYSTRNIVLAALFVQTLFVPIIVGLKETECPVARKRGF